MDSPFFSIIIPTYNRAHLIIPTLESIRQQTFHSFEVIIVDDGSTDNTEAIISEYLTTHDLKENWFYYKKENAERAAARNFGTHLSKGKFINWFDSDDFAYPHHLQTSFDFINTTSCKIAHFGFDIKTTNGELIQSNSNYPEKANQLLINGNCLSCNNVFVESSIANRVLFNEDTLLSASEDYELWMRLSSLHPVFCSNVITSTVIQHDERSVTAMHSKQQLIERFTRFIQYTTSDTKVLEFLGSKKDYFLMNNYLLLSVELAANKHKKEAKEYLVKAIKLSKKAFFKRSFYATIKHLIF